MLHVSLPFSNDRNCAADGGREGVGGAHEIRFHPAQCPLIARAGLGREREGTGEREIRFRYNKNYRKCASRAHLVEAQTVLGHSPIAPQSIFLSKSSSGAVNCEMRATTRGRLGSAGRRKATRSGSHFAHREVASLSLSPHATGTLALR